MFAKYLEETSYKRVFETDKGFFVYQINGKEFYVQEVYVEPEYRKSGIASDFDKEAVKLAKEFECEYIKGSIVPTSKGATDSMKFQLALGYKLAYCDRDIIYLVKNIGE